MHNSSARPSALFVDLYQLTMMQAYYAEGMTESATFELFFRQLPPARNYVMAAGLDSALSFLEDLRFYQDDLDWLAETGQFSDNFLRRLADFRFSGDVRAVAEGTIVFPDEPVIQVRAPLPEAQLVETYLLNQVHLQSVEASKAARVVVAAQGRRVVDFGSRRSHGVDAALQTARCTYLAGGSATSNVEAGRRFGIPTVGTMAHSYVQAHDSERDAFRAFARQFPGTTLLVDTYDTLGGVDTVIALKQELGEDFQVGAVRLDSGNLGNLAREARRCLDAAGLEEVKIIVSSGLNEIKIAALLADDTPIDGFGVGTDLAVSADAPDLDFAYKLVEYAGRPRMKLSSNKLIRPGPKQVFRRLQSGRFSNDTLACADESLTGEALLQPVMKGGERLAGGQVTLEDARHHATRQLAALPPALKALDDGGFPYPVACSEELTTRTDRLQAELKGLPSPC